MAPTQSSRWPGHTPDSMRVIHFIPILLVVSALAFAGPKKARTDKEGYAGTEACLVCHEDMGKAFLKSRHGTIETDAGRGWKGQSCESCHGPGTKHGEAAEAKFILNHVKANPREADASCLSCHKNQATHAGRISGSHSKVQVACVSCHSVHHAIADNSLPLFRDLSAKSPAALARLALPTTRSTRVNEICSSCHASAWASFQRPHGHAVPQGAMSCVDCHNPHGTSRPFGLNTTARTTNNEPGCFKCHADKRGPFAFEHAPVRMEGCSACHENHGSANPRLLNRPEVSRLCLECHSNTPALNNRSGTLGTTPTGFHDLRLPLYRNCTSCHTKVHGSHINRDLLR
jgi:DmsE family decaheme c-type cytochrome